MQANQAETSDYETFAIGSCERGENQGASLWGFRTVHDTFWIASPSKVDKSDKLVILASETDTSYAN